MRLLILALIGLMALSAQPTIAQHKRGYPCVAPTIVALPGVTTRGTDGADVILGTEGDDFIDAGAGDDVVCGLAGSDHLYGQDGVDLLIGDDGDDRLVGGTGADSLRGGRGDDRFVADVFGAGPTGDECNGGRGIDEEEIAGVRAVAVGRSQLLHRTADHGLWPIRIVVGR